MDGQRRAESEVWDKDGEVGLREGTGKIIRLKISLKRGIRQASDCVGEPARLKRDTRLYLKHISTSFGRTANTQQWHVFNQWTFSQKMCGQGGSAAVEVAVRKRLNRSADVDDVGCGQQYTPVMDVIYTYTHTYTCLTALCPVPER